MTLTVDTKAGDTTSLLYNVKMANERLTSIITEVRFGRRSPAHRKR